MGVDVLNVGSSEEKSKWVLLPTSADMIQLIHTRKGERGEFRHVEIRVRANAKKSDVNIKLMGVKVDVGVRQGRNWIDSASVYPLDEEFERGCCCC